MDGIRMSLLAILSLIAPIWGVTQIKTITINSPTSGAALNPVGAAINTKLHAKMYSNFYPYGLYSPYGGIGLGAGLAGYRAQAVGGYESYGDIYGYQYGYPALPGSYFVKTIYPNHKDTLNRPAGVYSTGPFPGGAFMAGTYSAGAYPAYPGGYSNYPNTGGLARPYPGYGNAGLYGTHYVPNQLVNNRGFLSYDNVKKLSGYGS